MPNENLNFPENLMLRKRPDINKDGMIYNNMDILLTDKTGNQKHSYKLGFNVIGKIND